MSTALPTSAALPTYTLTDLGIRPVPTLRLKSKKKNGSHVQKAKEYFENFMQTTENEVNEMKTQEQTPEEIEAQKHRLIAKFSKMHKQLDKQQEITLIEFDNPDLTREQREEIIAFWDTVGEFFMDVLNWFQEVFSKLIEKIKQGWKFIKSALRDIFKELFNGIKSAFN